MTAPWPRKITIHGIRFESGDFIFEPFVYRLCTVFEPFLNRFWTGDHLRLNPSLTLKILSEDSFALLSPNLRAWKFKFWINHGSKMDLTDIFYLMIQFVTNRK